MQQVTAGVVALWQHNVFCRESGNFEVFSITERDRSEQSELTEERLKPVCAHFQHFKKNISVELQEKHLKLPVWHQQSCFNKNQGETWSRYWYWSVQIILNNVSASKMHLEDCIARGLPLSDQHGDTLLCIHNIWRGHAMLILHPESIKRKHIYSTHL